MTRVMLDSFSGSVADLKGADRTAQGVLDALRKNPRVSVWDMDLLWLRNSIYFLERTGKIEDDKTEAYPWIRYKVLP